MAHIPELKIDRHLARQKLALGTAVEPQQEKLHPRPTPAMYL